MASVDCNSEQSINSAEISSDGDIPHVKSSLGFTVYYEMSENTPSQLSEVIVINDESNERLHFLEECLMRGKLHLGQGNFAECLLKEAERIFDYGGDVLEGHDSKNTEQYEETCATICQYFLKGKCRFGDKCFNLHEKLPNEDTIEDESTKTLSFENNLSNIKSKAHEPENKIMESEKPRKKPPMKTATDVINRIQWDEKLNPEQFAVGYLDRFIGIVENSFNSFNWEDVTSLDPTILAIPKHRIQYFKYCDEVVWDKSKRLDCVFGSTGSGMTIVDVIESNSQKQETLTDTHNVES